METQSQQPIIVNAGSKSLLEKAIGWLIGGAVVVGGGLYARSEWIKYRQKEESKKIGTSPEHQAASKLANGFNPSGSSWLKDVDSTNEGIIFSAAKEIAEKGYDWAKVVQAYSNLYGRNLGEDLKAELDADEYDKFFNIINLAKKDLTKTSPAYTVKPGHVIVSTAVVNIRKTPRWTEKGIIYASNVIATAESGRIIGVPTGRTSFDENPKAGVLFLEVKILDSKEKSKNYTAWVASSQVKSVAFEEIKGKKIPVIRISGSVYESTKSISGFGDVNTADFNYELITTGATDILDLEFQHILTAPENIILGYPIQIFKQENDTYIKFLTIDDTVRIAKTDTIQSIERG